MAGIWDDDLNGPVTPEAPPPAARGPALPAVPYLPGSFAEDLNPPPARAAAPAAVDNRPFLTRADETAGDAIRAFTNAVTLGQMDRIAGGMNRLTGQTAAPDYNAAVNEQVALSDAAEKRSPAASLAGGLAGGVALPGFGGAALATKLGGGTLGRLAGYGAAGAGVGAAQGAGNTYTGNAADYARNAVMGGVLGGALGGTLGAAVGPRPRVSAARTPTEGEINAATDFGYDTLRANKGIYENPHPATLGDRLASDLSAYTPSDIPTSLRAVERLRATAEVPGGGITPAELESIRAGINKIPKGQERSADRTAGYEVKKAIDDFYTNPPLGAVRHGTEAEAAAAGETADLARKMAKSGYHAEVFNNILRDAHLAAANPRGGPSFEDAVWSGVRGIEKSDRPGTMPKLAGYSDAEKAALEKIAFPGFGQRFLRAGSKYLGADQHGFINPISLAAGGAGAVGTAGYYLGADPTTSAIAGAAIPLTGLAMRGASTRMARKAIQDASDIIHQSNPLYDYRVLTSGTKPGVGLPPTTNDAVRNALATELVRRQPQMLPPVTVSPEDQ